jgi:hypothetical protein
MRCQQRLDAGTQLWIAGAGFLEIRDPLRRIRFFNGAEKDGFLGHGEPSYGDRPESSMNVPIRQHSRSKKAARFCRMQRRSPSAKASHFCYENAAESRPVI